MQVESMVGGGSALEPSDADASDANEYEAEDENSEDEQDSDAEENDEKEATCRLRFQGPIMSCDAVETICTEYVLSSGIGFQILLVVATSLQFVLCEIMTVLGEVFRAAVRLDSVFCAWIKFNF